jgi:peptidyl-prolyl cis-trans isomerase B (cyclophilin B)
VNTILSARVPAGPRQTQPNPPASPDQGWFRGVLVTVRTKTWAVLTACAATAALGVGGAGGVAKAGVPALVPGVCLYTPDVTDQDNSVGIPPPFPATPAPTKAVIETSLGAVTVALDAAKAPCTVHSFAFLADNGFFEGTRCHRMLDVPKAGVLQCGDPTGLGSGGPGYEYGDENLSGAKYPRGTLAMANHGADTNGSQFFLTFRDSAFAPDYTPFGSITAGLGVLDAAAKKGTYGENKDQPKAIVAIRKVTVS